MQALLKFILIAFAIFWLLKLVARLLFPWAVKKAAEKMMKNADQFQGRNGDPFASYQNSSRSQNKKEGEIRIDFVPPKNKPKKGKDVGGEFVDYEEVK